MRSRRRSVRAALSPLVVAMLTLVVPPGAFAQGNVCRETAATVLRACNGSAAADADIARAKCRNLSDPAARNACFRQEREDLRDARQACAEERDARLTACARLGPDRYDPVVDPSSFSATIDNPYFPLRPGTTFVYEGQTTDGFEHSEFAVSRVTRVILGVTCVEVHDRVWLDGELAEDTLDWFAQDASGAVWYFGENTHELADGLITTIDGSFMAGVDGDKPGIVMESHPAIGDFYRQEFSLGNAEDYAEIASLAESVTVPAGTYNQCLRTHETTPLEPELREDKLYAPGVGNVLEIDVVTGDRVELVRIETDGRP